MIDISSISIDTALPKDLRIATFIDKVVDPYNYMVGDITVHVEFCGTQPLQEIITKTLANR